MYLASDVIEKDVGATHADANINTTSTGGFFMSGMFRPMISGMGKIRSMASVIIFAMVIDM